MIMQHTEGRLFVGTRKTTEQMIIAPRLTPDGWWGQEYKFGKWLSLTDVVLVNHNFTVSYTPSTQLYVAELNSYGEAERRNDEYRKHSPKCKTQCYQQKMALIAAALVNLTQLNEVIQNEGE